MPNLSSTASLTLPAGMRATRAVQALLSLLPAQPADGWTEHLVEEALQRQGVRVNRVTVYRALDRLVQAGTLLRSVDGQRITRYWVTAGQTSTTSTAHMECTACHQSMELDANAAAVQAALQALRQALVQSTGITNAALDVAIHAQCAQCTADGSAT